MRKSYLYLILISFIIVVVSIFLYTTHKTYYLNLSFYGKDTMIDSKVAYTNKIPSCMEIIGINLKDGQDVLKITDKQVINLVIDYLNNVPLVPVSGYFDESMRVFVIGELSAQGYDFLKGDKEEDVLLRFYDENQIEIGNIKIYNEKYICDPNYRAYKVVDDVVASMVSDLRSLLNQG